MSFQLQSEKSRARCPLKRLIVAQESSWVYVKLLPNHIWQNWHDWQGTLKQAWFHECNINSKSTREHCADGNLWLVSICWSIWHWCRLALSNLENKEWLHVVRHTIPAVVYVGCNLIPSSYFYPGSGGFFLPLEPDRQGNEYTPTWMDGRRKKMRCRGT